MKDWKHAERRIAEILGGRRVPVSGRGRGDNPDVEHPTLSVEVKARASFPAWLEDAMRQTEAARDSGRAEGRGRVPVAVLHRDGTKYLDALCVMRLGDLAGLVGQKTYSRTKKGDA